MRRKEAEEAIDSASHSEGAKQYKYLYRKMLDE